MKICRAAFESHQSLGLVLDEARTPNANLLQAFLATPITCDVAQGFCCPPQIMPDMHVCFGSKTLGTRIAEATTAAVAGKNVSVKPSADHLVFTHNTIKAMENAVWSLLSGEGLMRFMPKDHVQPVVKGEKCWLFDIGGGRQRWETERLDEDSSQQQSPVLPGARALSLTAYYPLMLPPPSCPPPLLLPSSRCEVIVVVVAFCVVVVAL